VERFIKFLKTYLVFFSLVKRAHEGTQCRAREGSNGRIVNEQNSYEHKAGKDATCGE